MRPLESEGMRVVSHFSNYLIIGNYLYDWFGKVDFEAFFDYNSIVNFILAHAYQNNMIMGRQMK